VGRPWGDHGRRARLSTEARRRDRMSRSPEGRGVRSLAESGRRLRICRGLPGSPVRAACARRAVRRRAPLRDEPSSRARPARSLPSETRSWSATLRMWRLENEAVERALRSWSQVRCCYEAAPDGLRPPPALARTRHRLRVMAPSFVPRRPGERVKTDPGTRRCTLTGCSSRSRSVAGARGDSQVDPREYARRERMRARHLGKLPRVQMTVARRRRPGASPVAAGSRRSVPQRRPARPPSSTTCTPPIWSMPGSGCSSGTSQRSRAKPASPIWSAGWVACARRRIVAEGR
jgi:hypothetical protein